MSPTRSRSAMAHEFPWSLDKADFYFEHATTNHTSYMVMVEIYSLRQYFREKFVSLVSNILADFEHRHEIQATTEADLFFLLITA